MFDQNEQYTVHPNIPIQGESEVVPSPHCPSHVDVVHNELGLLGITVRQEVVEIFPLLSERV